MKQLLIKEFRLALHPMNVLFLLMSAMLMIPNYPYYITFFYTTLGIFFMCLFGRENKDIDYTLLLPVGRRQLVRARMITTVIIELIQVALCIPFAVWSRMEYIRQAAETAGIDRLAAVFTDGEMNLTMMKMYYLGVPNVAFFGFSFVMLGIFNAVFFILYYRNPSRVGVTFVWASVAEAVFVALTLFGMMKNFGFFSLLRSVDPEQLTAKLIVLAIGVTCFAALTVISCRVSEREFEKIDL
ncbi:MAG: ABC-2 transporter permease [bacterium]|nr:ABC-2 transporter permease [bacterium]